MRKKYFVDLFAGCGGLSRGLENAGFVPAYVNEINNDALNTYLTNRDKINPLLRKKHHSNDIKQLVSKRGALLRLVNDLDSDYGVSKGELDLVTGGPPCQGFSIIGHRRSFQISKNQLPYNYLYKDMVKAIKHLNPKIFLFENVGGLLSSRWDNDGTNGEVWEDVRSSFGRLNYNIRHTIIHARQYGVPQNRPRVIMVGIRADIKFDKNATTVADGLLPDPTDSYPHPKELLDDLVDPEYLGKKSTDMYLTAPKTKIQRKLRNGLRKGDSLAEHDYANHAPSIIKKFTYMIKHGGKIQKKYQDKKFYQKVIPETWNSTGPNLTIASNPTDYVHYSQPRILTVRECARFQMFPDTYKFTGKRHTGGRRRAGDPDKGIWARDVPKYTQIGNAVPVSMAEKIGRHVLKLLK